MELRSVTGKMLRMVAAWRNGSRANVAFNAGGAWKLSKRVNLLFAVGRDIAGDTRAMLYVGLQFLTK